MLTETLRPNAVGDSEDFIPSEKGNDNYEMVDEESKDNDSTYNSHGGGTSHQYDLYGVQDHSVGAGVINKITVYAWARETEANAFLRLLVKSGTTQDAGDTESLTTSYALKSHEWAINPDTGAAWTWAEIDAIQIGVEAWATGGAPACYVTQVYVVVDYTPGVPAGAGSFAQAAMALLT